MIELLIRGDDAGGTVSANLAIAECHRSGILNNASVMAVGSALVDAARRLSGLPQLCLGLHVTLNSEWTFPRVRPCLPSDQIPSLVDSEGVFLPSPQHIAGRGFVLIEAMNEVRAQLHRIRSVGIVPSYIDEHMGVGWLPGLAEAISKLCDEEGLVFAREAATSLPQVEGVQPECIHGDRAADWIRRIESAPLGRYVLVTHPLTIDDESNSIYRSTDPPGTVAMDRERDRQALLDPAFLSVCRSSRVQLRRYVEVGQALAPRRSHI